MELCVRLFKAIFGMVAKVDWGAFIQQKGLHRQPLSDEAVILPVIRDLSRPDSWQAVSARLSCIAPAEVGVLLLRLLLRSACDTRARALREDAPLARFIDDSILSPMLATSAVHSLLDALRAVAKSTGGSHVHPRASLLVLDILQVAALCRLPCEQMAFSASDLVIEPCMWQVLHSLVDGLCFGTLPWDAHTARQQASGEQFLELLSSDQLFLGLCMALHLIPCSVPPLVSTSLLQALGRVSHMYQYCAGASAQGSHQEMYTCLGAAFNAGAQAGQHAAEHRCRL
jgi:hypothetical protein